MATTLGGLERPQRKELCMSQSNKPIATTKKKKRRKWPWVLLLLITAVAVFFFMSLQSQIEKSYQQETAAVRDIQTYYSFSGHLSPVSDKIQTAKESIKVKEVFVKEGDVVAEGQALLRGADGTRVYAAQAGSIDELFVDPEDQLQVGSQIVHIVDYETLEVSVDVDEYDISALSLGKQGTVYLNALNKTVVGTVSEIARDATTDGGVSYYKVKLEIDATEDIRSGMSVEVNVLDKEALGCVSLSPKALSYDEYNKPFVMVRGAEDSLDIRYVTLGISDGMYIQVLEGLQDGETVYYTATDMARFFMMRQSMGR